MMRNLAFSLGKPALAVFALFLTDMAVGADKPRPYPFRGSNAFDVGRFAPSAYGYPLDDYSAGYYGGGRYREYYSYGRGYVGWAAFPDSIPGPGLPPDYRGPRRHPVPGPWYVPVAKPVPSPLLQGQNVAHIKVEVPADAEVWIEDQPTQQTGTTRWFVTPKLDRGETFVYEIRARWTEQGQPVEQRQQITLQAGEQTNVVFPTQGEKVQVPKAFPLPAAP